MGGCISSPMEEMVPPFQSQLDEHKKAFDKFTNPVQIELDQVKKQAVQVLNTANTVERRGPVCSICFSRCQISANPWQCTFNDRVEIDDSDSDNTPRKPVTYGIRLASCKHYFCGTCLAQAIYLRLNLEFDRATYGTKLGRQNIATSGLHAQWPIYCPTCIIQPGKQHVPISDVIAQQTLGEPNMEEWNHARIFLNLIPCSHKNCGKTFPPDEGAKTLIQCPWCGGSLCKACKSIWHENMTCERYQALPIEQRAPEDAVFLNLAKQEKWRRCPNTQCSAMVELKHGCNHITCVCGHHFCYICGAPFAHENGTYRCTGGENCAVWEEQQYLDY
ncbi:RBR-type E3 ubiquitin transferase [Mycena sanguinolenta]|uniref:RBR-type E3 ubiquitin transferase n=1 Tax=Mycena sanguinolenta TaxID=230812 RepID=A0A8H7CVT7_9AGAR|nr:RBR-type E3 ubiquitin transferase [Mycena sanguinolenta]